MVLRTLPARLGRRRTLIFGMACYVVGLLLLIPVRSNIGLLLPAIVFTRRLRKAPASA